MITRIREVRRARGMTLEDVAKRCEPPTTPQTIGRLETGLRTVSVGWLDRIAKALGTRPQDLIEAAEITTSKVTAVVGPLGATPPKKAAIVVPPQLEPGDIAVLISGSLGDYRAGDELWCRTLQPPEFGSALNRDVLVPRSGGRFVFGRLIDRDQERLQILPLNAGGRQHVVANPPWIAVPVKLVRSL